MIRNTDIWKAPTFTGQGGIGLVAIDPGETTGIFWMWASWQDVHSLGVSANLFSLLEREGQMGHSQVRAAPVNGMTPDTLFGLECQAVDRIIAGIEIVHGRSPYGVTHLAIEDFTLRMMSKDRSLLAPVRVTSMLYDRLRMSGREVSVHLQQSSDAMSSVTDQQLKDLGLWFVGREHSRAAAKHGVLFLRRLKGPHD